MKQFKKNNGSRTIFFQIGILFSIGLAIVAMSWKTGHLKHLPSKPLLEEVYTLDLPPITKPEKPEKIKEKAKKTRPSLKVDPKPVLVPDTVQLEPDTVQAKSTEIKISRYSDEDTLMTIDYIAVEVKPMFNGCAGIEDKTALEACFMREVARHIQRTAKIPEEAKRRGDQGRVWVSFVVNKEGEVEQAKIIRGISSSLDEEALRVVNAFPRIIPGKQRGKPVSVAFTLPINFKYR